MRGIKAAIIALLSVSFIAVGIFTVVKSIGDKPQNTPSPQPTQEVSAPMPETGGEDAPDCPQPTEEPAALPTEKTESSDKTALEDIARADKNSLDTTAVTWGPGVNFNDRNQPAACVNLQEKYGDLGAVFLNSDNKIYLSFDLGYESGYTNDILDVLKEEGVKAMFFVTGSYAEKQEEIVKRIISEGHTVGNHSWSHPDMTAVSDAEADAEIMKVHNVLKDKYGYNCYLFRFPTGIFSEKTLAIAAENGYHSVFWSFAYNDWDNANQPDTAQALQKTTERLHPGAVYLLHPMQTNSLILKDLIANARAAGYEVGVL